MLYCLQVWILLVLFLQVCAMKETWFYLRKCEEEITDLAYHWVGPITKMHLTPNKWKERPYFEWQQCREWKQLHLGRLFFQAITLAAVCADLMQAQVAAVLLSNLMGFGLMLSWQASMAFKPQCFFFGFVASLNGFHACILVHKQVYM